MKRHFENPQPRKPLSTSNRKLEDLPTLSSVFGPVQQLPKSRPVTCWADATGPPLTPPFKTWFRHRPLLYCNAADGHTWVDVLLSVESGPTEMANSSNCGSPVRHATPCINGQSHPAQVDG